MKIAIIGSGIAGLSAGRALQRGGVDVTLFDKSRGIGGRMSTRYADEWEFDHGAQFFTVQEPAFKAEVETAVSAGVVARWNTKGLYLTPHELSVDWGRNRYVGRPRMNSLPKYWAKDLDVRLGKRVTAVHKTTEWTLSFEDGRSEPFDGVISTLPAAQAAAILPPEHPQRAFVESAKMHACFCLMIGLDAPFNLGWDSLRVKGLPVDWIAVNHGKPGRSPSVGTIVVHSEPSWSDAHADVDKVWIEAVMLESASALTGLPLARAPHIALHRWLYASNKTSPNVPCLKGDDGFVIAGDWCLGGRVQGAWLSGRAAAQAFL